MKIKHKKKFFLAMFLGIYLSTEILIYLGLQVLHKMAGIYYNPMPKTLSKFQQANTIQEIFTKNQRQQVIQDPILGWTFKANANKSINSQGIKSYKKYSPFPTKNKIRICAFGDSFTQAYEVSNRNTWESRMENLKSNLEILNFGVGGYGLDQAYLRYQHRGIAFYPHVVFIGFMSENIHRNVNVYRPFYTPKGKPFSKPRFLWHNNKLNLQENILKTKKDYQQLLQNPQLILPKLGKNDYFYNTHYHSSKWDIFPLVRSCKILFSSINKKYSQQAIIKNQVYNPKSSAFFITTKIFDLFYHKVVKNQSLPIILVFPKKEDILLYRHKKILVYKALIDYLKTKKYFYVDLMEAFNLYGQKYQIPQLFAKRNHYNELGNEIVAQYMIKYLRQHSFTNLPVVKKTIKLMQNSKASH